MRRALAIALVVTGSLGVAACGGSKSSSSSTSASATTTESAEVPVASSVPVKPGCESADSRPKNSPALVVVPGADYTATMVTTEGTIVIALNTCTQLWGANNFVSLAKKGFYNNTTFHRVVTDFVIQGGDPKGTGIGGPGYEFVSELPAKGYAVGDLAWAKTGDAPPGSAGSQFFIVTAAAGLSTFNQKPYQYGQFGRVTSGLDVAKKIEALAPPEGDGKPTRKVTVKTVTITGP